MSQSEAPFRPALLLSALALISFFTGCHTSPLTGTAPPSPPVLPPGYSLTVNSTNPASGVTMTAAPADNHALTGGNTSLRLSYNAGAGIVLTAPPTAGNEFFSGWTGCTETAGQTCTVLLSAATTVTANYKTGVSVAITPATASAVIGGGLQFQATVAGAVAQGLAVPGVTWTVGLPDAGVPSPVAGTISPSGFYQTPFPAPSTVLVRATSIADPVASASALVTLLAPPLALGPALSVDTSTVIRPIDPFIYGMNNYSLSPELQAELNIPLDRWGGDGAVRYNYLLDVSNAAANWFFENSKRTNPAAPEASQFNSMVEQDRKYGSKTIASMPLIGWTTKGVATCGFSVAKYGAQKSVDRHNPDCGLGVKPDGTQITGTDPTDTSDPIDEKFVGRWVQFLVKRFGGAKAGGIPIYELSNEPEYYSGVHRDVHPAATTYDEITNTGLAYAKAIKAADSDALVTGPVVSDWKAYFYSWADLEHGWHTAPCHCFNGAPTDRLAHGDIPFLAYYLQQFKAAEKAGGTRLLDYLDLHTYFAPPGAAFAPAGDTALQAARLNSTRAFWDPSYTDPAYTDPAVRTRKPPAYPPQLIPRLKDIVAANYPGTKTAITEYAWGGQESINGALAQADILGIFGKYGLDLATLWGPPDPVTQVPGVMAFKIFLNYDGHASKFGDGGLAATSDDQGKLSIYAAKRSTDGDITVLILNKTFGDLTSTLKLQTRAASATAYQYSQANLNAIAPLSDQPITPSAGGGGSITATFPAQSMTLFVLPQ